jgi:hypothetical protein
VRIRARNGTADAETSDKGVVMKGLADGSFSTIPACEDSDIVGAVGSFPFELTVPGRLV